MNSSTSTHAPAVEAIIPVVLTEMNTALKPRGIVLDVQNEPYDHGSLTVFNATVQGALHQDTMRLTIDPRLLAVYDPASQTIEPRRIEVGLNNNVMAEIKSGLREGEQVVSGGAAITRSAGQQGGFRPPGGGMVMMGGPRGGGG